MTASPFYFLFFTERQSPYINLGRKSNSCLLSWRHAGRGFWPGRNSSDLLVSAASPRKRSERRCRPACSPGIGRSSAGAAHKLARPASRSRASFDCACASFAPLPLSAWRGRGRERRLFYFLYVPFALIRSQSCIWTAISLLDRFDPSSAFFPRLRFMVPMVPQWATAYTWIGLPEGKLTVR